MTKHPPPPETMSMNTNTLEPTPDFDFDRKHVLEIITTEQSALQKAAADYLVRSYGIEFENDSLSSSTSSRRTRGRSKSRKQDNTIEETAPMRIVETELQNKCHVSVPYFLQATTEFLRGHMKEEGIFRKPGSLNFTKTVHARLNDPTVKSVFQGCETGYEVASVLKQLLQKMTEPLLPTGLHDLLIRCSDLAEEDKPVALSVAICLIPLRNLHALYYLMEFLKAVTENSETNKMDPNNLALMMAPNIMPVKTMESVKGMESGNTKILLQKQANVVKILIEHGYNLGYLPKTFGYNLMDFLSKISDDEHESERGRKRRSASMNRMFDFFRKNKVFKKSDTPDPYATPIPAGYTPVIKPGSSRSCREPRSTVRKDKLLNSVLRNTALSTPSYVAYGKSPAVCLNPSPLNSARKQPFKPDRNHSTTKQQGKSSDSFLPSTKMRLFGKKSKTPTSPSTPEPSLRQASQTKVQSPSVVSIHPMKQSPVRAKIARVPSTRIPKPDNPAQPLRNEEYSATSMALRIENSPKSRKVSPSPTQQNPSGSSDTFRLTPMIREIQTLTLLAHTASTPVNEATRQTESVVKESEVEVSIPKIRFPREAKNNNKYKSFHGKALSPSKRRDPNVSRRKSESNIRVSRTPKSSTLYSSLRSPRSRRTPLPMTRSPQRCTLRRGRPNTMRAGLSRPSPSPNQTSGSNNDSTSTFTPILAHGSIAFDKKGRVSRRGTARTALQLPLTQHTDGDDALISTKRVPPPKPIRKSLTGKANLGIAKSNSQNNESEKPSNVSYIAAKLRKVAHTTDLNKQHEDPEHAEPVRATTRSQSMRVHNESPKLNSGESSRKSIRRSITDNTDLRKLKRHNSRSGIPLRRGVSVQELVKKFDSQSSNAENKKPILRSATLMRGARAGKLNTEFGIGKRVGMYGTLTKCSNLKEEVEPISSSSTSDFITVKSKLTSQKSKQNLNSNNNNDNNSSPPVLRSSSFRTCKQALKTANPNPQ